VSAMSAFAPLLGEQRGFVDIEHDSRLRDRRSPAREPTAGLGCHRCEVAVVGAGVVICQRSDLDVAHIGRLRRDGDEIGVRIRRGRTAIATCQREQQRTDQQLQSQRVASVQCYPHSGSPHACCELSARYGQRRARIGAADVDVRVRRAHDRGVELMREIEIVEIAPKPRQLSRQSEHCLGFAWFLGMRKVLRRFGCCITLHALSHSRDTSRFSPFRHIVFLALNWKPRKSNEMTGKSPRRFTSLQ
jgi:hypothetical protein